MAAVLVITAGAQAGKRLSLEPGQRLCLGRGGAWADVRLPDAGVLDRHACIDFQGGVLTAAGVQGEIQVNGLALMPGVAGPLCAGDRLQVGGTELAVTEVVAATLTPAARRSSARIEPQWLSTPGGATIRRQYATQGELLPALGDVLDNRAATLRLQRQLETVYQLGNLIHSERRLDRVFALAVESVLAVSGAERSALLMIDEATLQPREVALRVRGRAVEQAEFPVNRTIVLETLREGVSLLVGDAMHDPRFQDGVDIHLQTVRSAMCVPVRDERRVMGAIYVDHTDATESFNESDLRLLTAVGQQVGIAIQRGRLIADLEDLFVGTIHTLVAAIEAKDRYTKGHSERVTNFALVIADVLGIGGGARSAIELSGLLHDVGKIGVPEAVLNKNTRLNDAEQAIIREHPVNGARIIENIHNIDRVVDMDQVILGVLHHHERFDGMGYPAGLAGATIPLSARVLAVADTFDAMTSDRSYRRGANDEIGARVVWENSGTQFDPACVEAFIHALRVGAIARSRQTASRFLPGMRRRPTGNFSEPFK